MKQKIFLLAILFLSGQAMAQQPGNLEKIVGIVGDRIVLNSDIETAYLDAVRQNPSMGENLKCDILEQTLGQKILAEQADRDSLEVSPEEVEGALENQIRNFINRFGSEEKLEEVSGKSIYQLKDEYREVFLEQLKAERMQQKLMGQVKITPQEVRAFYGEIPQDSLPFYPSMVEIGQIIFSPEINEEVKEYAKQNLEKVREDIEKGVYTFDAQASMYSEDPGSRDQGGDMGFVKREELVPEFSAVAFRLQPGEISKVVKTEYGYHIIEMIERRGENAHLRHILIKPLVTSGDIKKATEKADSVRAELMAGKITFSEAVKEFSGDKESKLTGGMVTNLYTGNSFLELDQLDPAAALAIKDLKVGQYSQPHEFTTRTGDKTVRIIYLRSRSQPHKANLEDDYNKIQQVALGQKQNEFLYDWLEQQIPTFYIQVDEAYQECPNVSKWLTASPVIKK